MDQFSINIWLINGPVLDYHKHRTAIIFFYLSNEGLSILENTAKMGLPIPGALERVLAGLKGRDVDD